jgi:hypothetical protein
MAMRSSVILLQKRGRAQFYREHYELCNLRHARFRPNHRSCPPSHGAFARLELTPASSKQRELPIGVMRGARDQRTPE